MQDLSTDAGEGRPSKSTASNKMGKRRSGRDLAFRLLFQCDVGGQPLEEVIEIARTESDATEDVWNFAVELARGAWESRDQLDAIITRLASGWTLERMANADRNILRIALYEILHREDIPQSVSINEAVELAKRYSTAESSSFINGILGTFSREQPQDETEQA